MTICRLHGYSPKRRVEKPITYDSCGACKVAYDAHQHKLRWRRAEVRTARTLGGRRNPGSGAVPHRDRGDVLNGIAGLLGTVEVRCRARAEIGKWADECNRKADPYRPWLLVWDDPTGTLGPLAVMKLEELAALLRGWADRVT